MTPCSFCGQYHETTACPPVNPVYSPAEQYESSGLAKINGLSFGEHEICRRLDRIIDLLAAVQGQDSDQTGQEKRI